MAEKTSLFDLVLTGQLAQGVERSSAIMQLALLFKMPAEKIDSLMQSAPVVLKRELAWDVAKRYRVAIKQAGALSDIRPSENKAETSSDTAPPMAEPVSIPQTSAVQTPPEFTAVMGGHEWSLADAGSDVLTQHERTPIVSRLDEYTDFSLRPNVGNLLDTIERPPSAVAPANLGDTLDLSPPGSAVLAEHERALPVAALVATPSYEVARVGERLSEPSVDVAQAPDVSHLVLSSK